MLSTTSTVNAQRTNNTQRTKLLLTCGVAAGPVFIILAILQLLIRPGFDVTRDDLSLLSNGQLGWIQVASFLLSGLLVLLGALGFRQAFSGGKGSTWGPVLLALYGAGTLAAGVFEADPMNGFPPGTPSGPPLHPTVHGTLHILAASLAFLGLIAACFVVAHRFQSQKQPGWALYSRIIGVVFLAAFIGVATGSQQKGTALQIATLAFASALVLGWTWITAVLAHSKKQL